MIQLNRIFGIDFGATNICIGIWNNYKNEIIPNELGKYQTPSLIYISGEKIIIGEGVKNYFIKEPTKIIQKLKLLIGRNYKDKVIQSIIKSYNFEIIEDIITGKCLFLIKNNNENSKYKIIDILSLFFQKCKKIIEIYSNNNIINLIITVPYNFNKTQRQCLIDAAKKENFNVLKIINETTAIAMTFNLGKIINKEKKFLIFDLGGSTLNISIIKIDNEFYDNDENDIEQYINVIYYYSSLNIGGDYFNYYLFDFCIKEFKKIQGNDIKFNSKEKQRIKNACEKAKIDLSYMLETYIFIENIKDKIDFKIQISRIEFEIYCENLFQKCINYIEEVIKNSKLNKNEIDNIILVGGSSKIPKIREIIKKYFNKEILNEYYNNIIPEDEIIAYGASFYGGKYYKILNKKKLILSSLGLKILNNKFDIIIPKGSEIPIKKMKMYETCCDGQYCFYLFIYQGNNEQCDLNYLLKEIKFDIIKIASAGEVKINVTFIVNDNYSLTINIEEIGTNNTLSKTIPKILNK